MRHIVRASVYEEPTAAELGNYTEHTRGLIGWDNDGFLGYEQ